MKNDKNKKMILSVMVERQSARAVIVKDGKVAVIHRINKDREYYTTPGGGVDKGESIEEALKREILEEIGQEVTEHEFLFSEEWNGIVNHYFRCHIKGDKLILSGPEVNPYPGQSYTPMWIDVEDREKINKLMPEKVREYLVK